MRKARKRGRRVRNPKTNVILIVAVVVTLVLFTFVAIGDDSDGVDHKIKYSSDEIWNKTYEAMGIDPKNPEAASLGMSFTFFDRPQEYNIETLNEELDSWILHKLEGKYLIDKVVDEDGCEAFVVMDSGNMELSVLTLNATEEFHTFQIAVTNPIPIIAEVSTYTVEDLTLGYSDGDDVITNEDDNQTEELDRDSVTPSKEPRDDNDLSLEDFGSDEEFLEGILAEEPASGAHLAGMLTTLSGEVADSDSHSLPLGQSGQENTPEDTEGAKEPDALAVADIESEQEEEFELSQFSKGTVEPPKKGVIVTVPAKGVGLVVLPVGQPLFSLPDIVGSETVRVFNGVENGLEKNFITLGKDGFNIRYELEESSGLNFSGAGASVIIELGSTQPVSVAQIYAAEAASVTIKSIVANSPITPNEYQLRVDTALGKNLKGKNAIESAGEINIENAASIFAVSEIPSSSAIYGKTALNIRGGALLWLDGETQGIYIGDSTGTAKMNVSGGSKVEATASLSRSNQSGDKVTGVYIDGELEISGMSVVNVSANAQGVVPQSKSDIWLHSDITPELHSYGVYGKSLKLDGGDADNNGVYKSTLIAKGGDVGAYFENNFSITNGSKGEFEGSWIGLFSASGSGIVEDGAVNLKATAIGVDSEEMPIGVGIMVADSLDIGKTDNNKGEAQYNGIAPKVLSRGSKVGIYAGTGHISTGDNAYTAAYGGVEESYDVADIPKMLSTTYGVYLHEGNHISASYNGSLMGYGGDTGIIMNGGTGAEPIIEAVYSGRLVGKGGNIGVQGYNRIKCWYSAYMEGAGVHTGISVAKDETFVRLFTGKVDTNPPSLQKLSVIKGYSQLFDGIHCPGQMEIYENSYIFGEGDRSGIKTNYFRIRADNENFPSAIVGKTAIGYYSSLRYDPAIPINPYTASVFELPAINTLGFLGNISAKNIYFREIFDGAKLDFKLATDIPEGLVGFDDLYILNINTGRGPTQLANYEWATSKGAPQDINGWDSGSIWDYGYMQDFKTFSDRSTSKLTLQKMEQRTSFFPPYNIQKGVGLMVQENQEGISILAEGHGGVGADIPGWTTATGEAGALGANISNHSMAIINADTYDMPAMDVVMHFYTRQNDTSPPKGGAVFNYDYSSFNLEYEPYIGGPWEASSAVISSSNGFVNNSQFDQKLVLKRLLPGKYSLTFNNLSDSLENIPVKFEVKRDKSSPDESKWRPTLYFSSETAKHIREINLSNIDNNVELKMLSTMPTGNSSVDFRAIKTMAEVDLLIPSNQPELKVSIMNKGGNLYIGGKVEVKEYDGISGGQLISTKFITIPKGSKTNIENVVAIQRERRYEIKLVLGDNNGLTDPMGYLPPSVAGVFTMDAVGTVSNLVSDNGSYAIRYLDNEPEAVFNIYLDMFTTDMPLKLVTKEDHAVPLVGGKFSLVGKAVDGHGGQAYVEYENKNSTGTVTLKNLNPLAEYTLTQMSGAEGYLTLKTPIKFKLLLDNRTGNWSVEQINPQTDDGWVQSGNNQEIVVENPVGFVDFTVDIKATGVWKPNGDPNFIIRAKEKAVGGKIYYQVVTLTNGDSTLTDFEGNREITAQALFENMLIGEYEISVIPPSRYKVKAGTLQTKNINLNTHNQLEFQLDGENFEYLSDSGYLEYNITIN